MRSFRFGKNLSPQMYAEDRLFNADGHVKPKREVENVKLVPKVMKLLKPNTIKEGHSSDEERHPKRAQERKRQFEDNMRMVDEEIKTMGILDKPLQTKMSTNLAKTLP